jgi:8-oxo-dGTP pyrophosphatase MutT (NUDIX family)
MKHSSETPQSHRPLVEIEGVFSIEALTSRPEGLQAMGRGATRAALLEGKPRVTFDSPEQAAVYRKALENEANFNNVGAFREARDQLKGVIDAGADEETIAEYTAEKDRQWDIYRSKGQKVGVRNATIEDGVITFDAIKVPYPAYLKFAHTEASPELSSLVETSGVAMPVTTADGRLVLQHRAVTKHRMLTGGKTRGNGLYADIPGASVAGMLDATVDPNGRNKPQTVDTDFVKEAILKEASEELGLESEQMKDVRIVGLSKDLQKPHDEFLLLAKTDLTASELYEASRQSKRNKNLGDADFEEHFIDIDATPKAIETLLTEVKSPLPPTHAAAMLAAGYLMVLETTPEDGRDALEVATEWRDRVSKKVAENYAAINQRVASYYEKFPEVTGHVPERYWSKAIPARNTSGYSAAYTPQEQGLPDFEDEMVRVGLAPEKRQIVSEIHLFDIDGVLSDPEQKEVIHSELFDSIITLLKADEPVALNTGRSVQWAIDKIVTPISTMIENKELLKNLSVIGEKGNTWAVVDDSGEILYGQAEVGVDEQLLTRVEELVSEKYSDIMGNLDPKRTMISYEMHKGVDLAVFHERQPEFVRDVQAILKELGKDTELVVDATTIAVDIESPHAGKALGATRFIDILRERDINFNEAHFSAYGDSTSDTAMAEELARRGLKGDFVYVGKSSELQPNPKYYTLHNVGGFTTGTRDYLQQQEAMRI